MIKLDDRGLVPAIVQDYNTGQVLMLGYMSAESIGKTIHDGQVWFYSRSRAELWHKGDTSGNFLNLKQIYVDCDGDSILLKVEPTGPVCHTGNQGCFFTVVDDEPEYDINESGAHVLDELFSVITDRKDHKPANSYTVELLDSGREKVAQKVIEEAGESALAAVSGDVGHLSDEVADLMYHVLVLLAVSGAKPADVWNELRSRRS